MFFLLAGVLQTGGLRQQARQEDPREHPERGEQRIGGAAQGTAAAKQQQREGAQEKAAAAQAEETKEVGGANIYKY